MMMSDNQQSSTNDVLGIDDNVLRRDFGRERGNNPTTTEAQNKAIDKLAAKLSTAKPQIFSKQIVDDEDTTNFDIRTKKRVILFEAKVVKKALNSIVSHTNRRQLILLNDVILITSLQSAGGLVKSEKLLLHRVLPLESVSILDLSAACKDEDPAAFEVRCEDRPYHFIAESESDKKIWLEELEAAIFAILVMKPEKSPGWQHGVIRSTIYSAAMRNDVDQLNFQISRMEAGSLDTQDDSGMTALHWASLHGNFNCVQILINNGCNVDSLNNGLNTALLMAAAGGYDDIVSLLIDSCANVYLRNYKDLDCLSMCVLYGHNGRGLERIIELLHTRGVDMNKRNSAGATPLHDCASKNYFRPILSLVDIGADVNIKHGRIGLTPLQLVCSIFNPEPETVRALLEKGAHPNWRDTDKRSAFELALVAHQDKFSSGRLKILLEEEGLSRAPSEKDYVMEFSQVTLPVLLELVKKGCRFKDEVLATVRASFKEVINATKEQWLLKQQPDNFPEFTIFKAANPAPSFAPQWVDDAASKYCLLCVRTFNYSNRRHHCRHCGVLCCDRCSAKQLQLGTLVLDPQKPSSPTKGASPTVATLDPTFHRVCDGCFNYLLFECESWVKLKKDLERVAEAERAARKAKEEEAAAAAAAKSSSSLSSKFVFRSLVNRPTTPTASSSNGHDSIGSTAAVAQQAMAALEERGAKISEVAEKSEQLKEAASDFQKMTRALLLQQQQKLLNGGRF